MADFDLRKDFEESIEEVYSKPVKAGRRTYFFDVKVTRNNDYYLTITESRKKQGSGGQIFYDKHKIYLYKEDFAKFAEGLADVVEYVKRQKPEFFTSQPDADPLAPATETYLPDAALSPGISSIDEEFDNL